MRFGPAPHHAWRFDSSGLETRTGRPLWLAMALGPGDSAVLAEALERRSTVVRLERYPELVEVMYGAHGGVLLVPPAEFEAEVASLRQYRAACVGALDGFWEWDLPSGRCWMSPQFKALLGYADDALPNTLAAWLHCLHPDERDTIWVDFTHHVHHNQHYDIAHRLRRADGSYGWYRFRGRTVFSEAGVPLLAAGSLTDIGTYKELEQRLVKTKEAAQQANQAKTLFLANMSHELRTPMNGVMGMLDLASRGPLTPQQSEYLTIARNSAEDLLVLLNDVLDLSKIETGNLELERVDFRPWDALDEVLAVFSPAAISRGVPVWFDVDASVPDRVEGDPMRFRQVVKNLLSNAVKFTERGEIRVGLRYADGELITTVRDTGVGIQDDRLEAIFEPFTQADASTTREFGGTGLGLAIGHRLAQRMGGSLSATSVPGQGSTFVFRARMERLEDAASKPFRGARVAVVASEPERRSLVSLLQSLGCGVWPVDAPRLDAVFSGAESCDSDVRRLCGLDTPVIRICDPDVAAVAVPCTRVLRRPARRESVATILHTLLRDRPTVMGAEADEPVHAPAPVVLGDVRVLVVEDHPVNQLVTRMYLQHLGVGCDVVGDGTQAVASVAAGRYDLVFMDCSMPVMDGFTATERIRANTRIYQPVIVALTASAMQADRDRCLAVGMDDHLSKPVSQTDLAWALAKHLPSVRSELQWSSGTGEASLAGKDGRREPCPEVEATGVGADPLAVGIDHPDPVVGAGSLGA